MLQSEIAAVFGRQFFSRSQRLHTPPWLSGAPQVGKHWSRLCIRGTGSEHKACPRFVPLSCAALSCKTGTAVVSTETKQPFFMGPLTERERERETAARMCVINRHTHTLEKHLLLLLDCVFVCVCFFVYLSTSVPVCLSIYMHVGVCLSTCTHVGATNTQICRQTHVSVYIFVCLWPLPRLCCVCP